MVCGMRQKSRKGGQLILSLSYEVLDLMWSVCKGLEVEKELHMFKELKEDLWSWSRNSKYGIVQR